MTGNRKEHLWKEKIMKIRKTICSLLLVCPVSYTHLDVYKRQSQGCRYGIRYLWYGWRYRYRCSTGRCKDCQGAGNPDRWSCDTVSYTHLDVYKRQIYGFGQKTGIDLPGEANTASLMYQVEDMKPIDLATNAFGQNYNLSLIHIFPVSCTIG